MEMNWIWSGCCYQIQPPSFVMFVSAVALILWCVCVWSVDIIDVNMKNIADVCRQSSRNCIVLYPLFSLGSNYWLISSPFFFFFLLLFVTWLDLKNQRRFKPDAVAKWKIWVWKIPRYSILGRLIDPTNTCVYIILLSSVLGCLLSQPFQKK